MSTPSAAFTNTSLQISVSGDLGSGKTTVARLLADRLKLRYVSTGELHRKLATQTGRSALEGNIWAERDPSVDEQIDGLTIQHVADGIPTVFDSRMAWHFAKNSLKVCLTVDPAVAAERLADRKLPEEFYDTPEDAALLMAERSQSERRRFQSKYGVDVWRLRNFDLILDTTYASPEDVSDIVQAAATQGLFPCRQPQLWLCPKRVLPLRTEATPLESDDRLKRPEALSVIYARPFFACTGAGDKVRLGRSLRSNDVFIAASLVAEQPESLPSGATPLSRLQDESTLCEALEWEEAYGFRFPSLPKSE